LSTDFLPMWAVGVAVGAAVLVAVGLVIWDRASKRKDRKNGD